MIESLAPPKLRRPRRPWLTWTFTLVGCCALLLRWGWVHYKWHLDELEYLEAIEEADRLDPGWRLADLEAARAVIPDDENSAFQVQAAHRLMPKNWLPPPEEGRDDLESIIGQLSPRGRLTEKQYQELADELAKVSDAIFAARWLAEMPRGRHMLVWSKEAMFMPLPHLDGVREISRLLCLDAVRQAQIGDIDAALATCRATLNAGRSLGDEPLEISQILRIFCQGLAVKSIERSLAQGEASEVALELAQSLLEDEANKPLLTFAARGERATWHQFLTVLKAGEFDRAAQGWLRSRRLPELDDMLDKKRAHASHGACLKYLTEMVEIRKLPLEQQIDQHPSRIMPRLDECSTIYEGAWSFEIDHFPPYCHRLALLRSGVTALAAERFRLTHDCWPDKLEDLVPTFLDKIPSDPFDGRPLRYKRLNDGVMIYSVGVNRKDDGGHLERSKPIFEPDTDVGFQLWDPECRGCAR